MKKNLGAEAVAFPTPVYIVGTYGKDDEPTAMNAAWGGICSSEPPCVMVAVRKERYTYDNIMERKEFTVNFPDSAHVKEADYMGLVSGRKVRKFETAGLTAERGEKVNAPIIKEFPMALECRLADSIEVGSHVMMVGEIVNVAAEESCLNEKGTLDIEKVDPIIYDVAGRRYNKVGAAVDKAFSAGIEFLTDK